MQSPSTNPSTKFTEVEIARHPDGVIAIVTEDVENGRMSFSLAREFEKRGTTHRTQFLGRRHIPAAKALLTDLEEHLETLEDRARARRRG